MVDAFRPYSRTTLGGLISSKAPPQYTSRELAYSGIYYVAETVNFPYYGEDHLLAFDARIHKDLEIRTFLADGFENRYKDIRWTVEFYRATARPDFDTDTREASPTLEVKPSGTDTFLASQWVQPGLLDDTTHPFITISMRVDWLQGAPLAINVELWANAFMRRTAWAAGGHPTTYLESDKAQENFTEQGTKLANLEEDFRV